MTVDFKIGNIQVQRWLSDFGALRGYLARVPRSDGALQEVVIGPPLTKLTSQTESISFVPNPEAEADYVKSYLETVTIP